MDNRTVSAAEHALVRDVIHTMILYGSCEVTIPENGKPPFISGPIPPNGANAPGRVYGHLPYG